MFFVFFLEWIEKVLMGLIKNVVLELIEGYDEYYMLVRYFYVRKLFDCLF